MSSTNYEGKLAPSLPLPELYHDLAPHEFIKCLKSPQRPVAPSWDAMLEDGGGDVRVGGGGGSRETEEDVEKITPALRSQTEIGTFPTLSGFHAFSRPARQSRGGGEESSGGFNSEINSIQMFALLGSREIWDKTWYKIFMVLIPFSLKRMTIETCTYE